MSEHRARDRRRVASGRQPAPPPRQPSAPPLGDAETIFQLQRTVGNQSTLQLLSSDSTAAHPAPPLASRALVQRAIGDGAAVGSQVVRVSDGATFQIARGAFDTSWGGWIYDLQGADGSTHRVGHENRDFRRAGARAPRAGAPAAVGAPAPAVAAAPPPQPESLDAMVARLTASGVPLLHFLTQALARPAITLDKLRPRIAAATTAERNAAWMDSTLMAQAKTTLAESDYLSLLPALNVFKTSGAGPNGKIHTPGDAADRYIRQHLAQYVVEAVRVGRQVAGQVAVVDGADWDAAYTREFGNDGEKDVTNGFCETKPGSQAIIWLHKDRGDAGTTIHEGLHKYSANDLMNEAGYELNEGVTEYFTRQVCDALNPRVPRTSYQSQFKIAEVLALSIGDDILARFYFDGGSAALTALKAECMQAGVKWAALKVATMQQNWLDAYRAMTP